MKTSFFYQSLNCIMFKLRRGIKYQPFHEEENIKCTKAYNRRDNFNVYPMKRISYTIPNLCSLSCSLLGNHLSYLFKNLLKVVVAVSKNCKFKSKI